MTLLFWEVTLGLLLPVAKANFFSDFKPVDPTAKLDQ